MSWFKNLRSSSSLFQLTTSSSNRRKSISQDLVEKNNINGEIDAEAALESLKCHWAQAWSIMQIKCVPSIEPISIDDITSIVNHIDHILTLLVQECQGVINSHTTSSPVMMSPLLDYLLMESVLDKLLSWSLHSGEWYDIMLLEQLKLYELLVSQLCQPEVLFQKPLIRPLSILLSQCNNKVCPLEVDKRLVVLLNTLCVCIGKNVNLIELFFVEQPDPSQHKFLIFSLLVPFVHREGAIGQQARDALLLCMAIARTNDVIGKYISEESDFCPVLATGLSGLYSALPRKLSNQSFYADDWQRITNDDVQEIPELETFLNSLEFCNAVVQISHPLVQQKLLDYIYNGFLVLVVGPALHQDVVDVPLNQLEKLHKYSNTLDEIIATTAYLELFVRTISEPILLRVFLKFICVEKFEDQRIIDTLILRINSQSRLCVVNLVLFRTLIDLNCEDFMLELIFKHIINCDHLVGSKEQKTNRIKDTSSYNISAQKFLTFIPLNSIFHLSNETKSSFEDDGFEHIDNYDCVSQFSNGSEILNEPKFIIMNYLDYLNDAHTVISNCIKATKSWNNKYNSICLITDHIDNGIPNNYSANNSHVPNGYNENENNSSIGPFLSNLLNRLEMMCDNDFYINLHLTGLISRLACYPQPLIRSFLLNSKMTFKNEVKSLWTILTNLRNKFDNSAVQITNFDIILKRAKRFLKARDEKLLHEKNGFSHNMMDYSNLRKGSITSITSEIDSNKPRKRKGLKDILFRRNTTSSKSQQAQPQQVLESVSGGQGYRFVNRSPTMEQGFDAVVYEENEKIQKIVLAMIVFEEFMKEISSISYEHYILEKDFD